MKRDFYTGINYVYMLNERAIKQTDPDEATADRVQARRMARQLLTIIDGEVNTMPLNHDGTVQDPAAHYWRDATRVEALLVLDDPGYNTAREALLTSAPQSWMEKATEKQLADVGRQLADVGRQLADVGRG
jgi:hypothetical protein